MSIILGIDYGTRRIGVAIADTATAIATPLTTLNGRKDVNRDARNVADLAAGREAEEIVVGLPLNADGSEGDQANLTRRFAEALERLSGLPIRLQDERLTSFAAEEVLDAAEIDRKKRKGLIDQIAAQKILQAYLDSR